MKLYLIANLILLFSLASSCTLLRKTEAAMAKADKALGAVAEVGDEVERMKKEADTDGDGETSISEWMTYLLGGGLLGGAEAVRRRNKASGEAKEEEKARNREEIATIKTELAVMAAREEERVKHGQG